MREKLALRVLGVDEQQRRQEDEAKSESVRITRQRSRRDFQPAEQNQDQDQDNGFNQSMRKGGEGKSRFGMEDLRGGR